MAQIETLRNCALRYFINQTRNLLRPFEGKQETTSSDCPNAYGGRYVSRLVHYNGLPRLGICGSRGGSFLPVKPHRGRPLAPGATRGSRVSFISIVDHRGRRIRKLRYLGNTLRRNLGRYFALDVASRAPVSALASLGRQRASPNRPANGSGKF